jgi:hypothetical protein
LKALNVLDKESVSVVPGKKNVFQNIPDTFLLEAQIFSSHHRGIDEIKAKCISSIFVDDLEVKLLEAEF